MSEAFVHAYYDDRRFRMYDVCRLERGRRIIIGGPYSELADAEAHVLRLEPEDAYDNYLSECYGDS
jgi:hypothetical protein